MTAVVVTSLFVGSLILFSALEDGKAERDRLESETSVTQTESITADKVEATPTPTPSPTPTPIPVYVPDSTEILPLPDLTLLAPVTEGLIVQATELGYDLSWTDIPDASYYILYISTDGIQYVPTQILTSGITQWKHMEFGVTGFLLVAYEDHAVEGMTEDTLLASFLNVLIQPTATPTPKPTPTSGPKATKAPATPTPIPTPKPLNKYKIIVDKADSAFAVFTYDESGEYTVRVATYPAALGGRNTPTGSFTIGAKIEWRYWTLGHNYSPFSSTYKSGRYFHGPIYSSKDRSTLEANSYNQIGNNTASGGCVRTTVRGAMFVYYNCAAGTVVEIVQSSDLVSYPGKAAIDPNFPTWDPTDPDKPTPTPSPVPTATSAPTPTPTPTPTATPTPTPIITPDPTL